MKAAALALTFVLVAVLLLPVASANETKYIIKIADPNSLLPGRYGLVVLLEENRYTAFVYEKGNRAGYLCADYFLGSAVLIHGLNLNNRSYVFCATEPDGVAVPYPPEQINGRTVGYIVVIEGILVRKYSQQLVDLTYESATVFPKFDLAKTLAGFVELVRNLFNILSSALTHAGKVFGAIVDAIRALWDWIGGPGEVDAIYYYNTYRSQLTALTFMLRNGTVVQDVLECRRPVRDALHLIAQNATYKYEDKTLCEIEAMQPRGVVGALQVAFGIASWGAGAVSFVVKNFVLINASIVGAILLYGLAESARAGSLKPIDDAVRSVYRIFKFYWDAVKFVFELIMRIAQAIAEVAEAVWPF